MMTMEAGFDASDAFIVRQNAKSSPSKLRFLAYYVLRTCQHCALMTAFQWGICMPSLVISSATCNI
jgi:hypothetical protein